MAVSSTHKSFLVTVGQHITSYKACLNKYIKHFERIQICLVKTWLI